MMFQRKSPSIFFLLACSLILSQVTHVVSGAKPKKSVSPSAMVSSDSLPTVSTSEPRKEAKTSKSAEAKSKSSGAPTFTILPTSINKTKVVSKSKKSGAPTVTNSPTSIKQAKLLKSGKADKSESKSKKSNTPTTTIAPTSFKQAKSVSKSKKSKAGKSTTSLAPTVTNPPTLTHKTSKKEGTTIQPPDRTIGSIRLVDTPEETTSSDISNEETPEEESAQNANTTLTKEGRGAETNIFVNGEATEMTDGSDQNKDGEKAVIAKSDGITDKSTSTSKTTIIGLVVLGAVFCGVAVGVYMKMSTSNPIDEN
mmetsp:Transcript_15623/g.31132  ORF Transcript_15623/g.31132 Transcript_15623/m.31132 type:complete len:310 (+) Transcript_15623:81-1010(+)